MKLKIVFFDCDGVLIFGKPWLRLHTQMGIPPKLDREWMRDYYNGKLSFSKWNENVEHWYLKHKLTRDKFEDILNIDNYTFNQEANELIKYLRHQKIEIAIISAGIDYYVSKTAQHFGIDHWRANYSFVFNNRGDLQKIQFLEEDIVSKTNGIKEYCKKFNQVPTESVFIGDSRNDLGAFKLTQHGILYKGIDPIIQKAAWQRVNHLGEVVKLIQ